MIDIDKVDLLEAQDLENKVAAYREKLLQRMQQFKDSRSENLRNAMEAKNEAEKKFPDVLKRIEARIEAAVRGRKRSIVVSISADDPIQASFMLTMLFQALPMQGFICNALYNRSEIRISW